MAACRGTFGVIYSLELTWLHRSSFCKSSVRLRGERDRICCRKLLFRLGCDLATWVCRFRVKFVGFCCSPNMVADFSWRFLCVMHDVVNARLCMTFSLLVKKLDFGIIPPWSLLLLPCASGQMQAEMSRDFPTVAFSLPVDCEARNAPKLQLL